MITGKTKRLTLKQLYLLINEEIEYTEYNPEMWSDSSMLQGYLMGLRFTQRLLENGQQRVQRLRK